MGVLYGPDRALSQDHHPVKSRSEPLFALVPEAEAPRAGLNSSWIHYWLGLLWSEWFIHSRLLVVFIWGWLSAIWLLPLVTHPLWVLVVGVLFALVAGPAFGGSDVIHGCEEFTFTLPATRDHRFIARLGVGGGGLLVLTAITVVSLDANLSDILLRIFLDSGLGGVEFRRPELLYGLLFAFPFAIFAIGFSVSAVTTRRTVAFTSWVWGALGALSLLRGGTYVEELMWDRLTGRLTVPALLISGLAILVLARFLYQRKEAGASGNPLRMPLSWWGGMGLVALAGLAIAALIGWLMANVSRWI